MGGTLQSDLAWPSQGWTNPARDLRLNRSSRSSSRRSKIEITSKMPPGVKERQGWEEACEDADAGSPEPGSQALQHQMVLQGLTLLKALWPRDEVEFLWYREMESHSVGHSSCTINGGAHSDAHVLTSSYPNLITVFILNSAKKKKMADKILPQRVSAAAVKAFLKG